MRTAAAALLAFLALTGSAGAQATATATPAQAGKGTRLHTELDAKQPPVSGRLPRETVLSIQSGYRFDGRAVAKRCTADQASSDSCPARSAIGTATVRATYSGMPVTVPIALYLARPATAGDVAGFFGVANILGSTYSAAGRVVRSTEAPFGLSVILATPGGDDFSTLPVTFDSFEADLGAFRTVRKGTGKKRRKVRYALITNPPTCAGTWASRAAFTFSDGTTATLDAPISCDS